LESDAGYTSQGTEGATVEIDFATGTDESGATVYLKRLKGSGSVYADDVSIARVVAGGDPSVAGWWRSDRGETTADTTGNGNTGRLSGGVAWVQGQFGNALRFDGSSGYVDAGVAGMAPADAPQSFAWWMRVGSFSIDSVAISLTNSRLESGVELGIGEGEVGVWKPGRIRLVSGPAPSPDSWHHFVYTFDGSDHRLYIDAVLVGTATVQASTAQPTELNFGRSTDGTHYLNGELDEIRLYSRTLSPAEVRFLSTPPAHESLDQ
jgi:hypothetical protein